MTERHIVRRGNEAVYETPEIFASHSHGFSRWNCLDQTVSGAVHTGYGICQLSPGGSVSWHVHSYEVSFFLLDGSVVLDTSEGSFGLAAGDYGFVPLGMPHAWHNAAATNSRWAEMLTPQPRPTHDGDTYFVPESRGSSPAAIDIRDPRTRSFGHIDPANMDVNQQTQDRLAVSASMRTALLVYSGITVKMMVDSDLGSQLGTMFMVQYVPGGFAGAHDHPLEETYLIVEGETEAVFDGHEYRLVAGDFAFAGVGAVHEFSNPNPGIVRWLETQAPQPPSRHSYRFARDWRYLIQALEAGEAEDQPPPTAPMPSYER